MSGTAYDRFAEASMGRLLDDERLWEMVDRDERLMLADALDKIGDALGKLASVLADHERRICAIERKLNHKGGNE